MPGTFRRYSFCDVPDALHRGLNARAAIAGIYLLTISWRKSRKLRRNQRSQSCASVCILVNLLPCVSTAVARCGKPPSKTCEGHSELHASHSFLEVVRWKGPERTATEPTHPASVR